MQNSENELNLEDIVIVSEADFMNTFAKGLNWAIKYYNFKENPENPHPNLNRKTKKKWSTGTVPHSISAYEEVSSAGLCPLTYKAKHFKKLNIFAAHTFFTGCIPNEKLLPKLSLTNEQKLKLDTLADGVPLFELKPKEKGYNLPQRIGRLMACIGITTEKGSKANHNLEMPHYIRQLVGNYSKFNQEDRKYVQEILQDFTQVLLENHHRYVPSTNNKIKHMEVYTFDNHDKKIAEAFGRETIDLINVAYLGVDLGYNHLHVYPNNKNTYSSRIRFNKDKLNYLHTNYGDKFANFEFII